MSEKINRAMANRASIGAVAAAAEFFPHEARIFMSIEGDWSAKTANWRTDAAFLSSLFNGASAFGGPTPSTGDINLSTEANRLMAPRHGANRRIRARNASKWLADKAAHILIFSPQGSAQLVPAVRAMAMDEDELDKLFKAIDLMTTYSFARQGDCIVHKRLAESLAKCIPEHLHKRTVAKAAELSVEFGCAMWLAHGMRAARSSSWAILQSARETTERRMARATLLQEAPDEFQPWVKSALDVIELDISTPTFDRDEAMTSNDARH